MKSSDRPPFDQLEVPERMIRKLSELLKTTDLAEIEISSDQLSVRVKAKETSPAFVHQVASPISSTISQNTSTGKTEPSTDLHIVRSPFIGTFYRAPSPTSAAFVEEGQMVSKGQILCIVEAMKIMNEIESDVAGVIDKIFVENGTPVDFNAPLFGIRKPSA